MTNKKLLKQLRNRRFMRKVLAKPGGRELLEKLEGEQAQLIESCDLLPAENRAQVEEELRLIRKALGELTA